ncbi:MAG: DUF370 domain-containing protein [Clostridiales bacterium]|nr:DUF370 domain-containing protein [Clostridiales bacterium]
MYLHLGENKTVKKSDIVGIFDSDTATVSKITRKFLSDAEKNGMLETVGDLPKSFTLIKNKQTEKIYFSQLSSKTLAGRAFDTDENNERK